MTQMYRKGFTLIELLVVIAIIGILSSVVLASLNTARGKGANASVKANLNGIRAQAELVYDNAAPDAYSAVCADSNVGRAVTAAATAAGATVAATDAAGSATTATCQDTGTAWAAQSPLRVVEGTLNYWCVDSTGNSRGSAGAIGAAANVCP